MVQLVSFFEGLARSMSLKKTGNIKNDAGRELAEQLVEEARKKHMLFRSHSLMNARSNHVSSIFSRKGGKDINQDFSTVWKNFGNQKDMIFCGVFDGHGPWGHLVSRRVSKLLPTLLLCCWQQTLAQKLAGIDCKEDLGDQQFDVWKQSYLRACAAVDKELEQNPRVDSFRSGTTALAILKEGDHVIVANVGDSRAVLATTNGNGKLVAVQLTVDLKPNLPQEAERIIQSNGRIFCFSDEPGVYRFWKPDKEGCGLALSRAFGDHCIKDFGLISMPDVTGRYITSRDEFIILATDGVWEVLSNEEAIQIVASAPEKEKSAKRLVKSAAHAWKCKKPGVPPDDISAICLYLNESPASQAFDVQLRVCAESKATSG